MTEDEAKTKWCPQSIFAVDSPAGLSGNRWDNGDGTSTGSYANNACKCIGSGCMAWRWDKDGWSMMFDDIGPCLRKDAVDLHGYCGLAGKS